MRVSIRSVVTALALVAVGFAAGTVVRGDAAKGITRWTPADLKWSPVEGTPVMMAAGWSSANGSYCHFNKFPKGTKMPLHHHSADLSALVISGKLGSGEQGTAPKLLSAGGYQFIPGGLAHTTECGPDADCVILACGPAAFDYVDEKPAAK
jgi:hypothetical protein